VEPVEQVQQMQFQVLLLQELVVAVVEQKLQPERLGQVEVVLEQQEQQTETQEQQTLVVAVVELEITQMELVF
jgi:hypothetical protein